MQTESEIALHQALVALIAQAQKDGVDVDQLVSKVNAGLLGNAMYRIVEHPHVTNAIDALNSARENVQAMYA